MELKDFFKLNNKIAVAFSGGVDSAYLLYAATKAGADVTAYYVKSQFQPDFELQDAIATADYAGARMRILQVDALSDERVSANPANRCYYCKNNIMGAILKAASEDGYDLLCDGTNASDDADDRPGFRALGELGIRSPLRECGLTKAEIRLRAKEAGLSVWNKPAYACLATRIPTGEIITEAKLMRTEESEKVLFDMGFTDFRVRTRGDSALIQVTAGQHDMAKQRMDEITKLIGGMYESVSLDEKKR